VDATMTMVPVFNSYWQYVEHWSQIDPDYPSLREDDRVVTAGELQNLTDRLARAFLKMGIGSGDRIVSILPSSIEYVLTLVAAGMVNAILVPLDVRFRLADLRRFLSHAQPKVMIAHPDAGDGGIKATIEALGSEYADITTVVVSSDELGPSFEDLLASDPPLGRELEVARWTQDPHDGALVVFTGGTTGVPKAALLSHRNMAFMSYLDVVYMMRRYITDQGRGKMIAPLPPSHVGGTVEFIGSGLVGGSEMILMNSWSPHEVLSVTEREKLKWIGGVPTMYAIILAMENLDDYDLSSVELAICSGEKVPLELLEGIRAKIAPKVISGYGSTEAGAELTLTEPGDDFAKIADGYGGKPLPTVKIRIEIDDGTPLPQGEVGEIVTSGPLGIRSYFNMPEEDREGFTADGWVRTGDLGYLDEDGGLFIIGRKKHIIRVGSYTVVPAEVEEIVLQDPAVAVAAAIGVPDPIFVEQLWLFVMPEEGATIDEERVMALCKEQLASFKVPRRIVVRENMPITRIGKIDRKVLEGEAEAMAKVTAEES
jgi:acyl-CoA synthetase (AMP-forming)/AMP-acid ligase II